MVLASLVCLSLFCFVSGALFVVAARMVEEECAVSARVATSSAYLLEAAGSGLGGIVASILLLRFLGSFQIATIVAILNLCMAAVLLLRMSRRQIAALTLAAALCAIPLIYFAAPSLDRSSQARLWRGFHLVGSRDSIYGNLTVTGTGDLRSIYQNGVILANAPDQNAAEEAVDYALLESPAPRRVLLIGGGVNGSIAEALKHPTVERIDYVELDPALIDMARQFFPAQSAPVVSDPRVHMHYADGRYYLRTAGDRFDVIIVNVPDPQTAQINRFYTAEFFRSARDHLAPGGLLALQLQSSEETISPDLAQFPALHTAHAAGGLPLHRRHPRRNHPLLRRDPPRCSDRQSPNFDCKAAPAEPANPVCPGVFHPVPHDARPHGAGPRATAAAGLHAGQSRFRADRLLLRPCAMEQAVQGGSFRWFQAAAHVKFTVVLGAALVFSLLAAVLWRLCSRREKRARYAAACCMAATGFTLIALQIVLLLAFQSIYGYVYYQLAILIGLCMAGIAFGSWLSIRRTLSAIVHPAAAWQSTQLLLALSAPALIFVVAMLARISGVATTWLAAQLVFPALAALAGMLGGYQFPIATQIYLHGSSGRSRRGTLYAIDLLGGCAGALLLSTYLIPVFGFWKTAWLCAAINLGPALLAARVSLEANRSGV